MSLSLATGEYALELCPQLGGAVTGFRWQGREILRRSQEPATEVISTACFPLLPFANRIADGRFEWQGRVIRLPVLTAFAPHALHGTGWQMPWSLVSRHEGEITLGLDHPASDWPWRWSARQRFSLSATGLEIALTLTNLDGSEMPAGMGFHPCFALADDRQIRFKADHVWPVGDDLIPDQPGAPGLVADFRNGLEARGQRLIDHCYSGWDGLATVQCKAGRVRLTASSDLCHLHVFMPPDTNHACLEPVTHRPDAVHGAPDEMPVLAPGHSRTITMGIAHEPT